MRDEDGNAFYNERFGYWCLGTTAGATRYLTEADAEAAAQRIMGRKWGATYRRTVGDPAPFEQPERRRNAATETEDSNDPHRC